MPLLIYLFVLKNGYDVASRGQCWVIDFHNLLKLQMKLLFFLLLNHKALFISPHSVIKLRKYSADSGV